MVAKLMPSKATSDVGTNGSGLVEPMPRLVAKTPVREAHPNDEGAGLVAILILESNPQSAATCSRVGRTRQECRAIGRGSLDFWDEHEL